MGTAEVMGDGRGGLVAVEQPRAFATQVLRLLDDRTLHARLRQEVKAKALEWSAPATARRVLDLYASLAPARRRRAVG